MTNVEWMNPHARFYIDVKDEKGEVSNWELELGSPNGLMRQGWTRNSLKKGDVVSVPDPGKGRLQAGQCPVGYPSGRPQGLRRLFGDEDKGKGKEQ